MLTLVESPLHNILRTEIARTGPMTVAAFMDIALYHPNHGYYITRNPIGQQGDFITAPEISQIFGELVGLWALETWRQNGLNAPLRLIELGPGHGTLAQDILRTLAKIPGTTLDGAQDIRFDLVETSPGLRSIQQHKLHNFVHQTEWFTTLAAVPPGPAIIIGNEFLDALPIRQFVRRMIGIHPAWHEIMVGIDENGRLGWCENPIADNTVPDWARTQSLETLPAGTVIETCPALPDFIQHMANRLHQHGGAVLLIDYGHDASLNPAQATWVSTLQALFRHQSISPLEHIGESDLTAHVDFGAIIRLAQQYGLCVTGPMPQGQFLQSLGGDYRCQQLMARHPDQAHDILTRWRRLITPSQMGHLFKVIMLSSEGAP